MISVLTGVLSALCTQELWLMGQVYQDFLFSSCFVFPNVFWGKEIVVLSLFMLIQNQIFTCSRDHRTQYNWVSCLLCSSPANQKLCYWKCVASSTSWHLALIRGTIRYFPITLILWFLYIFPPISLAFLLLLFFSINFQWSWKFSICVFCLALSLGLDSGVSLSVSVPWSTWVNTLISDLYKTWPCV